MGSKVCSPSISHSNGRSNGWELTSYGSIRRKDDSPTAKRWPTIDVSPSILIRKSFGLRIPIRLSALFRSRYSTIWWFANFLTHFCTSIFRVCFDVFYHFLILFIWLCSKLVTPPNRPCSIDWKRSFHSIFIVSCYSNVTRQFLTHTCSYEWLLDFLGPHLRRCPYYYIWNRTSPALFFVSFVTMLVGLFVVFGVRIFVAS